MDSLTLVDPVSVSPAVGDYLKAVYRLEQGGQPAETSRLGEALGGIKPSSVTAMLKRLARLGLLEYVPYRGASLTAKGRRIGLRVLRKHRLLELFLVKELGYTWEDVHEEAEVLEHHLSSRLIDRMDAKLGYPEFDPHGDPIPDADGVIPARETMALSDCVPGRKMTVSRVLDQNRETLALYRERSLVPGAVVAVVARNPQLGTILVAAGGGELTLDARVASRVLVTRSEA